MSKFNLLVSLNSYEDASSTNNANLNHFKWTRQVNNGDAAEPQSFQTVLTPGASTSLFSGVTPIVQDGTTEYELLYVSPSTYSITHDGGTFGGFRQDRGIGGDVDTEVNVTVSGQAITFTCVSGTAWDLSSVQIGDEVKVLAPFNSLNLGSFKVLSVTSDSFTIANQLGVEETGVLAVPGSVIIMSAAGVQIDDKVQLGADFGVAEGVYSIKSVYPDKIEIASTKTLPTMAVQSQISVFNKSKKLLYVESASEVNLLINGNIPVKIQPNFNGCPGILLLSQTVFSLSATPVGVESSTIFVASVE